MEGSRWMLEKMGIRDQNMTRKEFLIKRKAAGGKVIPFALMTMPQKYAHYDIYKNGYLDIETSGLKANFDITLSYAILVRDTQTEKTEIRHGVINRKDVELAIKKGDADLIDKRILEKLMEDMSDIDCLIGHWFIGKHRHDIPFIRTRCAINNVSGFPKNRMVRYGDTQAWVSKIHNLSSYSLATIGDAYNISTHKTQIKSKDWKLACLG
ncbi:MAG: hypothetical protein ACRD9Q_08505, partial [Nitrososphaeraceae archaeon]